MTVDATYFIGICVYNSLKGTADTDAQIVTARFPYLTKTLKGEIYNDW